MQWIMCIAFLAMLISIIILIIVYFKWNMRTVIKDIQGKREHRNLNSRNQFTNNTIDKTGHLTKKLNHVAQTRTIMEETMRLQSEIPIAVEKTKNVTHLLDEPLHDIVE